MISVLPSTTSRALVAAILDTLRDHTWPSPIATVGYRALYSVDDPDEPSPFVTPAIVLTIGRIDEDTEAMTPPGRVADRYQLQLHGVLSIGTPDVQVELLEMCDAIRALLKAREIQASPQRGQRWGLGEAVGYPTDITSDEGSVFADGVNGAIGRAISWSQTIYLPELPA